MCNVLIGNNIKQVQIIIDYRISNETNLPLDLVSDATPRDDVIRSTCVVIAAVFYNLLKRIINQHVGNQTHLHTETSTIILKCIKLYPQVDLLQGSMHTAINIKGRQGLRSNKYSRVTMPITIIIIITAYYYIVIIIIAFSAPTTDDIAFDNNTYLDNI